METIAPEEWVDDAKVVVEDLLPYDKFRYNGRVCYIKSDWTGKAPRRVYVYLLGSEEKEVNITKGSMVMRLKKKVEQEAKPGRKGIRRFLPI